MEIFITFLTKKIFNNFVYLYMSAFLLIVLANVLYKIISFFINKKIKKLTKEQKLSKLLLKAIKTPILLLFYILALSVISSWFNLTEQVNHIISQLIKIAVIINISYFIIKCVDIVACYFEPMIEESESKLDDQLLPLIKKSLKIFILIIATMLLIDTLGYNITSILAGLGIGGLAIALAAQDTLKNLFGSVTIFADRPFNIGDRVQVENHDGMIEAVGFRSTRIRTLDGTLVTIPNSKMADSNINNIGKRPFIKNMYTIGLTYDTSSEKIKQALEIIRTTLKEHKSTDNYWVYFKKYGEYSLDILVIHWCKYLAYQKFLIATEEINLEIKYQFEKAKIDFAFPTQTVHLEK
jgi:MscS family membrane protein